MEDLSNKMSFEEIEYVIDILNPCVDNFLFVLNLKNRHYVISENAVDRFPLPAADFPDYTAAFTKVVYEEDLDLLSRDLAESFPERKASIICVTGGRTKRESRSGSTAVETYLWMKKADRN